MLRAIIFDFDGVIVDTEPLHLRAFNAVLAEYSIEIPPRDYFARYVGLNDAAMLRTITSDLRRPIDGPGLERLQRVKDAAYIKLIEGGIEMLPGVRAFVDAAARRWPQAICSGARRVEIDTVLRHARLEDRFPVIVSADDTPLSKPDPAGYRLAIERLNLRHAPLRPEECLAIEDSAHGINAAKAAGMRVLLVRGAHGADAGAQADWIASSLQTVDMADLEAWMR